ncbi:energy transducer TonB [Flavobacterium selenitireducens]|uniref:energy transducer TonB n=1 Tax=Flavobacterium selenitireducens TaxID=2722704 RepID=UPI00168C060A|nr:energy transducer TonB [Flavobacterium selenitireducens]MBD3582462.1 energy transducer TonB [Flavobacterium selenitireducens]
MSKTSIFEKRWLDLVFEGRNKAYGAYQLRLENPKTTFLAMLYALLFVGASGGTITLLSSFGSKSEHVISYPIAEPLTPVRVTLDEPITPPAPMKPKTIENTVTEIPAASWVDPQVVSAAQATPDPGPVSAPNTAAQEPGPGSSNGASEGTTATGTGASGVADNTPAIPTTLQKQPMFPGGMDAFYKKIARDFEKPEMFDDSRIKIIMSFVIEKDGSMTDIKVLNRPGADLEKEAVRVLKSINKKWEPGIRNDKAVRTIFTLPIVIQPQQ